MLGLISNQAELIAHDSRRRSRSYGERRLAIHKGEPSRKATRGDPSARLRRTSGLQEFEKVSPRLRRPKPRLRRSSNFLRAPSALPPSLSDHRSLRRPGSRALSSAHRQLLALRHRQQSFARADPVMIIGIVGIAQTLVILTAGIDLRFASSWSFRRGYGATRRRRRPVIFDCLPARPLGRCRLRGYLNGVAGHPVAKCRRSSSRSARSASSARSTRIYSQSETIGMQDIEDKACFLQIMGNQVMIGSRAHHVGHIPPADRSPRSSGTS